MVNSRYPRFSATSFGFGRRSITYNWPTFSRSYGGILPSSLERLLSSALEYSSRPPESVCGTVTTAINSAGAFLGSLGSLSSRVLSTLLITSRDCLSVCPTRGPRETPYRLEPSIPGFGSATLLRPSCGNHPWWCRNINLLSITYAFRPRLRNRLTLGRLTLPRNPWAYGERVSHSFYRYSSLHKLFHQLHRSSPYGFSVDGMLAYRSSLRKNPQLRCHALAPLYFRRRFT